jgi:hypothetical protein
MIAALHIKQTDFTPLVQFNPIENHFEIKGESRPENTSKFYSTLLTWLSDFNSVLKKEGVERTLVFEFKFDYFNSTSAKFILDLFRKLEEIKASNPQVKITILWHYEKLDEDMRDSGEEFSHLVNLHFDFKVN